MENSLHWIAIAFIWSIVRRKRDKEREVYFNFISELNYGLNDTLIADKIRIQLFS
ncbi:hypothetical protein [Bacillus sp. ISL-45]|uniref:hypothetical protein n=1 Tax=Bacillus sp. ISL-45 TaxID=2819128 RepID=UPI003339EA91